MKSISFVLTDREMERLSIYCKIIGTRPSEYLRDMCLTLLEEMELLPRKDPEDPLNGPDVA